MYLATGAEKSQKMGVHGEEMKNVFGGVEFLRDFNANEEKWLKGKFTLGKKVAVIGGGNSAIDAARVALRLGAQVTILYRRLRQDMPAAQEEIKAAEEEGIKIEYLVAPLKIDGTKGKVSSIACQRMKLGDFDSSGRKKPVAVPGSEFRAGNCNRLFTAAGIKIAQFHALAGNGGYFSFCAVNFQWGNQIFNLDSFFFGSFNFFLRRGHILS